MQDSFLFRSKVIMFIVFILFISLIFRSFWIQVINNNFYIIQSKKRCQKKIEIKSNRGKIFDRNGELLAISIRTYQVWANPRFVRLSDYILLSKLLDINIQKISQKLKNKKSFVLLKRQISSKISVYIDKLKICGITQISDVKRCYPEGESTAHIIGFTNIEDKGQEGLELSENLALSGKSMLKEIIYDPFGRPINNSNIYSVDSLHGKNIRISIDRRIQKIAYMQLKNTVIENNAKSGSIVILDSNNGEILAITNWPSFDPNNRSKLIGENLRNKAIVDVFEPGSTIKPIIIALAIDNNNINKNTIIDTSPGILKIGRHKIRDIKNYGKINIFDAIKKSSNIALAKISMNLPAKKIWNKYKEYGIGEKILLKFPGVNNGYLKKYKSWKLIEHASMSYGYGISTSLLQIAQIYTVYANNGVMNKAKILLTDSKKKIKFSKKFITKPNTAKIIRKMLETSTGSDGTGYLANTNGYKVGGKTGTTKKYIQSKYVNGKYLSFFVGIAPIDNPKLIIAIMIDEPSKGKFYGGNVAAPLFSKIVKYTLRLLI